MSRESHTDAGRLRKDWKLGDFAREFADDISETGRDAQADGPNITITYADGTVARLKVISLQEPLPPVELPAHVVKLLIQGFDMAGDGGQDPFTDVQRTLVEQHLGGLRESQ